MKLKKLLPYTFILLLAVCFTACSDNSSGPKNEGEAPDIPDLTTKIQPDVSFFENNRQSKAVTVNAGNNYNEASGIVLAGTVTLLAGPVYFGFINSATQSDANFEDGKWVWEYNYSQGGASASVRTTAEP